MSTELAIDSRPLSLNEAIERRNALVEVYQQLMVADLDYGIIPGTSKPTLLKPGAEKLCNRFGLTPTFEVVECIRDFIGQFTNGEPLFFYEIKCRLFHGERLIAEGVGSCNSWESKYRYRDGKRICPYCGKDAIIKGKQEFGGGWLCYGKKGGCGAKFKAGDKSIEGQEIGRVANPDIFDVLNTVRKMADKRAMLAAVLIATGASEFFTQDVEDIYVIDVSPVVEVTAVPAQPVDRRKLYRTLEARIQEATQLGLDVQMATQVQMADDAREDQIIAAGKELRARIEAARAVEANNGE